MDWWWLLIVVVVWLMIFVPVITGMVIRFGTWSGRE